MQQIGLSVTARIWTMEKCKNSGKTCKSCKILPRGLLQLDRNPDGFPKALKNVGKTYGSAMWDAVDVLLASPGARGPAWDLHEEPWKTLANPCFSVVGNATTGAAGQGAGQVNRGSLRFPGIPSKTLQKRVFLQPGAAWGDRGRHRNVLGASVESKTAVGKLMRYHEAKRAGHTPDCWGGRNAKTLKVRVTGRQKSGKPLHICPQT